MSRTAEISRITKETKVRKELVLDGDGACSIRTGVGFLDHMLELLGRHGQFHLTVQCEGDTWVDDHHSVEDIGIALGDAFAQALQDKKGIRRYGSMLLPMDESLVMTALDLSGRGFLVYDLGVLTEKVGQFDTELAEEFFRAFAHHCGCTLHIKKITGGNTHHILEAAFKGVGRSLRQAVAVDQEHPDEIPSTKGVL